MDNHKKNLVVYYSKTGNNKYLAKETARLLGADMEEIHPRGNFTWLLILFSLIGFSFGIRKLRRKIQDYDNVILCGPIWAGQYISPLRDFVKKYKPNIRQLHFATCCGSDEKDKNSKFGYERVFQKVQKQAGEILKNCAAFSVLLVVPPEKREDDKEVLNIRLNKTNFKGVIKEKLHHFVDKIMLQGVVN